MTKRKKRRTAVKSVPRRKRVPSFDRLLLYLTAFFVFSMPLFIWPGITEYGYGKSIFALVGISILLAMWGVHTWVSGERKARIPWLVLPVLALVLASLLSLINAMNGRVVLQSLTLLVFFFLFYLLTTNIVREKRDVNLLLFSLLLSAFFASLYGLLQYLGVMRGGPGGAGLGAIISTMGNRNFLGGFLSYLLFPAVILIIRLRSRILRAVTIGLLSFSFGMAMLVDQAGTRVALLLALLALLIGWALFRPVEPIKKNRIWLIALLFVLAFTFLVKAPSGPLNAIVGLSAQEDSWLERTWAQHSGATRAWNWWIGWEMFKDYPLVGVGLGNYKLNYVPYKAIFLDTPRGVYFDFPIPRAAQAHNEYVQAAAELGSFGVLALLSILVVIPLSFWVRLRRNRNESDRFDLLLLACGVVVFLAHAAVSFPARLPSSSLVLVFTLALATSSAYGEGAVKTIHLKGWPLKGGIALLIVFCLGVSVIAIRDLQANLLLGQGIRQLQIGQVRLAEASFTRSINLDFAPRQVYFHRAMARLRQGRAEDALEDLKMCLTRFVAEEVFLHLANVALNLGYTEIAQENVDLLLSSRPSPELRLQAEYLRGLIAIVERDYSRAVRELEAIIAVHPGFERAHIALGDLYRGEGMPVIARKHYEKALSLIEPRLAAAESRLAVPMEMTIAEFARLRGEIDILSSQKEAVEAALAALPPS